MLLARFNFSHESSSSYVANSNAVSFPLKSTQVTLSHPYTLFLLSPTDRLYSSVRQRPERVLLPCTTVAMGFNKSC